ncbi:MAG: carboxypeptidase regulatory-like domain-containing protein, partial [Armatimonadota bacterium]
MCRMSALLKAILVVPVIALVMVAGMVHAATISGTIYANDGTTTSPSPDTEVVAVDNLTYAITDLSGNYTLTVPAGTYTLTVRRWEYLTQRMTLTVSADDNLTGKDFTLAKPESSGISACADFSVSNGNPNRVWSYGYQSGEGAFVPFATIGIFNDQIDRWWMAAADDQYGAIHRNRLNLENWQPNWWPSAGGMYWEPRMLTMAAGTLGLKSVIRWTAPSTGTYRVDVRYAGQEGLGVDANVYVLKNATPLFSGQLNGFNGFLPDRYQRSGTYEQTFLQEVSVQQGDTLDFAVDDAGTHNSDLVSASIDVIPLNPVPNGTITGIVTQNTTGNPAIPGARIRILNTSDFAITGSDGGYTLSEPPGTYTLEVRKRGFVPQRVTVQLASSSLPQDFSLDQTAPGTDACTDFSSALNPNGRWSYLHPSDDPDTYLWHGNLDPANHPTLHTWTNVTTEENGGPDLQRKGQISKNTGSADIWVDWFQGQEYEAGQLIQQGDYFGNDTIVRYTVPEGGTYNVDAYFTAQDTTATFGKVLVRVNGSQLFYGDLSGSFGRPPFYSDRGGLYEQSYNNTIILQRNDTVDFVVQSRNSQMPSDWSHPWATVGGNYLVTRVPGAAGTVMGTVRDTGGNPIQGVRVRVIGTTSSATTGADGVYEFVLPGQSYTLDARKQGLVPQRADITIVSDQTLTQDFTLSVPPAGTDATTSFSATSNPSGNWSYCHTDEKGTRRLYDGTLVVNPTAAINNLWSDVSGNVDLYGAVWKNAGPGSFDYWWNGGMYLEEGQLAQFGDFGGGDTVIRYTVPSLNVYDINACFTGQDEDNTYAFTKVDVNGVNVFQEELYGFYGKSTNNYADRTGVCEQSYFATRGLKPGDTVDFVVAGRGSHKPEEIGNYYVALVGADHMVTPNPNGAVISGTVRDSIGNPIEGARVRIVGADNFVTTGADGTYAFALLAGTYTVEARKSGLIPQNAAVTLTATQTLTRDFTLLVPPAGTDATASFSATNNPSGNWSYRHTDAKGTRRLYDGTLVIQPTAAVNNLWTDVGGNVDGYGAVWKSAGPGSFDMWWNGGMYLE